MGNVTQVDRIAGWNRQKERKGEDVAAVLVVVEVDGLLDDAPSTGCWMKETESEKG